jgi:hypothetical protein
MHDTNTATGWAPCHPPPVPGAQALGDAWPQHPGLGNENENEGQAVARASVANGVANGHGGGPHGGFSPLTYLRSTKWVLSLCLVFSAW